MLDGTTVNSLYSKPPSVVKAYLKDFYYYDFDEDPATSMGSSWINTVLVVKHSFQNMLLVASHYLRINIFVSSKQNKNNTKARFKHNIIKAFEIWFSILFGFMYNNLCKY